MKKLLWLLLLLFIVCIPQTNAQKTVNPIIYTIGVPGSCINGRVYVNVSTGFIYTYKSGVGCFLVGASIDGVGAATRIAYWSDADTLTSTAGFTFNGTNIVIPGSGSFGTRVDTVSGTTGGFHITSGSWLTSPSDGIWTIWNNAQTDFNRLQFGGTTSSFPSIKRSGTSLEARLADDSAAAAIRGQSAFVYRTSLQVIPHATWTSIQWDNELDDTNAFHDNVTNNTRFTINTTTAGRVTLKCTAGIAANATGGRIIRIYKNGTTIVAGPMNYEVVTNGDPTVMQIVADIPDATNADYYECQVWHSNSGAGALNSEATRGTMSFSLQSY